MGKKIVYETVDKTDPNAANTGRQQAQQENDRRMNELRQAMERQRHVALRHAEYRARCEDENERRRLDEEKLYREEEERKNKEEMDFRLLKHALLNYDFQQCPRIRPESFRDLDVSDVEVLRIALIGPTGSGKTSFVGTLQQAFDENKTAFEQGTGREGTILLEEYSVHNQVVLVDTRGFFDSDESLLHECLNIMSGRIRPAEEIVRNYDPEKNGGDPQTVLEAQKLPRHAHAVIFVVKANDPRLKEGKYKDTLKKIREHFKEDGYAPVTVITYLDKLTEESDKENAFDMASWATGSSSQRTYFIANYTQEQSEKSFAVDRAALDILDSALMSAERYIRICKQREKNQMDREVCSGESSGPVETVDQLFSRLQKKHNWTNQGKMKEVLADLRSKDINTVKALKELWEDVKPQLPLTLGMKRALEEEMNNI